MTWLSGKYLRYILFAVLGLAILHFISSASLPLPSTTDVVSKLTPGKPKEPSAEPVSPPKVETDSAATAITDTQSLTQAPTASAIPSTTSSIPHKPATPTPVDQRENATFVTLARNSDLWELSKSIRQVEDRFNRNHNYDWVFLNEIPFDDEFKKITSMLVSGKTHYGLIPRDQWTYPDYIDRHKAAKVREDMGARKIIYGDSESYRHMCRFESGFFFRHELMQNYDYYWRVEPGIDYYCDISFDPFKLMRENGKKYGWVISLYEYRETVVTLWDSVKKFMQKYPQYIVDGNNMEWISEDNGQTYNLCHFWSNFEIGDLNFLRSKQYIDFFEFLDREGGFFYERWGDAPVHSIAAALMLKKEEVHFFNEIAYYHVPFTHCPTGEEKKLELRCTCKAKDNFDWNGYSCTSRYFEVNDMEKPEGWDSETH